MSDAYFPAFAGHEMEEQHWVRSDEGKTAERRSLNHLRQTLKDLVLGSAGWGEQGPVALQLHLPRVLRALAQPTYAQRLRCITSIRGFGGHGFMAQEFLMDVESIFPHLAGTASDDQTYAAVGPGAENPLDVMADLPGGSSTERLAALTAMQFMSDGSPVEQWCDIFVHLVAVLAGVFSLMQIGASELWYPSQMLDCILPFLAGAILGVILTRRSRKGVWRGPCLKARHVAFILCEWRKYRAFHLEKIIGRQGLLRRRRSDVVRKRACPPAFAFMKQTTEWKVAALRRRGLAVSGTVAVLDARLWDAVLDAYTEMKTTATKTSGRALSGKRSVETWRAAGEAHFACGECEGEVVFGLRSQAMAGQQRQCSTCKKYQRATRLRCLGCGAVGAKMCSCLK